MGSAGDMASGIAFAESFFDAPDRTPQVAHVKWETTELTVWRKVDGQWRLAASFARPNQTSVRPSRR